MDFNKPRVAIYYHVLPSTGMRNDGPPIFMNYNFRKILNGSADMNSDVGNVVHLWPTDTAKEFGKFDLHVWVDYGEDALGVPLDWSPPSPSAYWVSDAHISADSYKYRLWRAKQFDFVFCAQRVFLENFERDGIPKEKLFYLPHAVEPDVYHPHEIIEKWDWCFIGHMNSTHRIELCDRFCKEFPVGIQGYLGWRMPEAKGWNVLDDANYKYNQSKIILNDYIFHDAPNMRTMEAMATGKCLLTQDEESLREHFTDGQHLRTYRSIDEAVELAKHLLANDEERIRIGQDGLKEILAKHTYNHRAREILERTIGYVHQEELINAH